MAWIFALMIGFRSSRAFQKVELAFAVTNPALCVSKQKNRNWSEKVIIQMTYAHADHYNFQPGATAIRLLFHSDSSESGRGFRIRYKLVNDCSSYFYSIRPSGIPNTGSASCFTRISESSGSINTPYYPKNYSDNLDCIYRFTRYSFTFCSIRNISTKKIKTEDTTGYN